MKSPMTKTKFSNVDEYISVQPEAAKVALLVRTTIRKAVPGAEEMISYNMPAYKLQGGITLYFAVWRQHYSLYPASERLVAALKEQLASHVVRKGTIRFPLSEPVPVKLIERIAKFRVKEAAHREQSNRISLRKR
jgi:uncharacterized protein YdhG (YjbR/CyaY superfamily)